MPLYRVEALMETYAVCEVVAAGPEEAVMIANELHDSGPPDWTYETDYDSSRIVKLEEIT